MAQTIHVFCARPGMFRGGRENPVHAAYPVGDHTPEQLREMLADPQITMVTGEAVTEEFIASMESGAAKPGRK